MAVNFTVPEPTYKAKRSYEQIKDIDTFTGIKTAFLNDETMGLVDKEVSGESFTRVINISFAGKVRATLTVTTADVNGLKGIVDNFLLDNDGDDLAMAGFGAGASAYENLDKVNFKMNFSAVTASNDPVKLAVDDSYATLSGYHMNATQTTVETWADSISALSVDPVE